MQLFQLNNNLCYGVICEFHSIYNLLICNVLNGYIFKGTGNISEIIELRTAKQSIYLSGRTLDALTEGRGFKLDPILTTKTYNYWILLTEISISDGIPAVYLVYLCQINEVHSEL